MVLFIHSDRISKPTDFGALSGLVKPMLYVAIVAMYNVCTRHLTSHLTPTLRQTHGAEESCPADQIPRYCNYYNSGCKTQNDYFV